MKFGIEVKVRDGDKHEWKRMHPTGEPPYEWETEEEAKKVLYLAYGDAIGDAKDNYEPFARVVTIPTSFKAEVIADSSGQWSSNALRFATEEEAKIYVDDLMVRWTMVRDTRIVPSDDPVSARLEGAPGFKRLIYLT